MRRVHVCSVRGCPELAPCPIHGRPADAPWGQPTGTEVCATPGCGVLVAPGQPCPKHDHSKVAWSPGRNHKAHLKLRRQIIKQRGPTCQNCGWTSDGPVGKGIHMHHLQQANTPNAVILLCQPCHKKLDPHAR